MLQLMTSPSDRSGNSRSLPLRAAHDLQSLSAAMAVLAEALPARTTVRQATVFTFIAYNHAMGRSLTLSEVMETLGGEVVGKAIERTISTFFPASKHNAEGLGWVEQEVDEDDRRKKYLRLTALGAQFATDLVEALRFTR